MTLKEADRLAVLKRVENKNLSLGQAARELGSSYRQIKRIWRRYKQRGAKGLISLRRSKPSPNRLPDELKEQILEIVQASALFQKFLQ
jgi:transposase